MFPNAWIRVDKNQGTINGTELHIRENYVNYGTLLWKLFMNK